MSTVGTLGLNLPVTATFAAPLSFYYIYLQTRVILQRRSQKKAIEPSTTGTADDALWVAGRAQANFAENVPLALSLAAIVEMNGGNKKALAWMLGGLTVVRVLHADFGLLMKGKKTLGPGRIYGYCGTQVVIAGLAGYAAWLSKGYWGI